MKSRDTAIRLKRFQVDEKRQQVADIETMIADFERMAVDLEQQIAAEQERSGISDVSHFAYPTFAKAAGQRRDNLRASIEELQAKLDRAHGELEESFEELKKVELMEEREMERDQGPAGSGCRAEREKVGVAGHMRR